MAPRSDVTMAVLGHARQLLRDNLRGLTIEEALQAAGGYRSVLGILKHTAGWSHVYYSFAFDPAPRHWSAIDWPRGLRDTIEPAQQYLDEVAAWLERSCEAWQTALSGLADGDLDRPAPCHWGGTLPLFEVAVMVAAHWTYHAGEINVLRSIRSGAAWEYSEEVEENHLNTAGHRIRPDWMSDEQAARYEAYLAARDAELRGEG